MIFERASIGQSAIYRKFALDVMTFVTRVSPNRLTSPPIRLRSGPLAVRLRVRCHAPIVRAMAIRAGEVSLGVLTGGSIANGRNGCTYRDSVFDTEHLAMKVRRSHLILDYSVLQ